MSILWWSTIDLTRASTTPEGSRAYLPPMWANFLVTCVTQFSCSTNGSWILYLQWLRRNIFQTRRFEATQDPACAFTSEVLLHSLQEVESSKWICSKGSSDTASSKLSSYWSSRIFGSNSELVYGLSTAWFLHVLHPRRMPIISLVWWKFMEQTALRLQNWIHQAHVSWAW
jgi:hypothetical protein